MMSLTDLMGTSICIYAAILLSTYTAAYASSHIYN